MASKREVASIQEGIDEVAWRNGEDDGYQWGHYIERDDREEWLPLIYPADEESVRAWHRQHEDNPGAPFRRSRVVRRKVGTWMVVHDD